jgi:hypothetical protein
MSFWWVMQEQKEAAMIKALENMGDVDMVSAEGEILGPIAWFDSVRLVFGEIGVVAMSKD